MSLEVQEAATVLGYHRIMDADDGYLDLETLLVAADRQYTSNDDDYLSEVGSSNVLEYQVNIWKHY